MIPVGATGFDTNRNCTTAAAELAAFGFTFGVRYVCQDNSITTRKIIRRPEYEALTAAGITVFLVSEWYTPSDSSTGTPSPFRYGRDQQSLFRAADEDCAIAFKLAADCGHTGLILHAVDWDATGNKTAPDMQLYLSRCLWNQVQTHHPFGVYCGGRMLRYLIDVTGWSPDAVTWWQASAWSSRFPEDEAHFLQTQQFPVGGVTVDLNTVFRPVRFDTTAIVPPPQEDEMAYYLASVRLPSGALAGAQFRAAVDASGVARELVWLTTAEKVGRCGDLTARELTLDDVARCTVDTVPSNDHAFILATGRDWAAFDFLATAAGLAGPTGPAGPPGLNGTSASVDDVVAEINRRGLKVA